MIAELSLTLQVSTDTDDGTVRLDPSDMRLLNLCLDDVATLSGARTTYARVLPAFMEDRNQRLVSVSPLLQRNLGVQSGHKTQVANERISPLMAETVTLHVEDDIDLLHVAARLDRLNAFWHERVFVQGDWIRVPSLDRNVLSVQVIDLRPEGLVQVNHATRFVVTTDQDSKNLPAIGGLRDTYRTCQKLALARLKAGLTNAARAVLLSGPAGCGKARMVRRLSADLGFFLITLDAHALLDKQIINHFPDLGISLTELARRGPTIVLLDHLEALSVQDQANPAMMVAQRSVVAHLCALLDEVAVQPNVMAFGVGSGKIDPRLAEHAVFDVRLPVDAPNSLERFEILSVAVKGLPLASDVDLFRIASLTAGTTANDLNRLVKTAAQLSTSLKICHGDILSAVRHIEFSALSEVRCDVPNTLWQDVAGLDDIKKSLRETLLWSLKYRSKFVESGVSPPRSILLSGAQGTGKTLLVQSLANVIPLNYIEVSCAVLAAYDCKKAVDLICDVFALARRKTPCLIFFDDIDALFDSDPTMDCSSPFSPIVSKLLIELDALSALSEVVVVAATNRPDRLSADVLRPGRLDYAVMLPLPDQASRKRIFQIHSYKLPLAADVDFDKLADMSQGFSPAEIANLCNRVGMMALRQSFSDEHAGVLPPVVNAALFEQAMRGRKA